MSVIRIDIPEDIIAAGKIPRSGIVNELKKEMAIHLYSRGILSLGGARRLAGLKKVDFHILLGQMKVSRHYDTGDYEKDKRRLKNENNKSKKR
jgi:predicted HTH domain antitoxin